MMNSSVPHVTDRIENDIPHTSYSPPTRELCKPLDLSNRSDPINVSTSSIYSSSESSPSSLQSPNTKSLLDFPFSYLDKKANARTLDIGSYGNVFNFSPYMIEAAAFQQRFSQIQPSNDKNDSLRKHIVKPGHVVDSKKMSLSSNPKYECEENTNVAANDSNTNYLNLSIKCNTDGTDAAANDLNTNNLNSTIRDRSYYERRQLNNASSKKSRDRRRLREDQLASRTIFLEMQNVEYKAQLAETKTHIADLKNEIELVRRLYICALQSKDIPIQ